MMTSIAPTIRTAVKDQINTQKDTLPVTTFTLEETYQPLSDVEALSTPKIYLICMASEDNTLTRAGSYEKEIPIQVALTKQITNPYSVSEIDPLVELLEDLYHVVSKTQWTTRRDPESGRPALLQWLRCEPLKDENGQILNYQFLRDNSVFLGVFTAFFKTVIPA